MCARVFTPARSRLYPSEANMEDDEMMKTPLTDVLEDDFFDDAVTAQQLIARLIEDALDDLDIDEDTTNDLDWVVKPTSLSR